MGSFDTSKLHSKNCTLHVKKVKNAKHCSNVTSFKVRIIKYEI